MIALYLTTWWNTFLASLFRLLGDIAVTFALLLGAAIILLVCWFLTIFLGQLIKILREKKHRIDLLWQRFVDFLVFLGTISVGFGFFPWPANGLKTLKADSNYVVGQQKMVDPQRSPY